MKLTDVRDIPPRATLKVTVLDQENPFKKSVAWYTTEISESDKDNGVNGLILTFKTSQVDGYSIIAARSIAKVTNYWLNYPGRTVEVIDQLSVFEHKRRYADEAILKDIIQHAFYFGKNLFESKYYKFDIDGAERAPKGFKFSEMKNLTPPERGFFEGGSYYFSEGELHQPVPLRIAKLDRSRRIDLINGNSIEITHITELGELIYDIENFKVIDRALLKCGGIDSYLDAFGRFSGPLQFQDSIEDCVLGDVAEHRPGFQAAYEAYLRQQA